MKFLVSSNANTVCFRGLREDGNGRYCRSDYSPQLCLVEKPLGLSLLDSRISLLRRSWKLTHIQHPLGVAWQYIILGLSPICGTSLWLIKILTEFTSTLKFWEAPAQDISFPEWVNVGITFGAMKQHRAVVPAPRGTSP